MKLLLNVVVALTAVVSQAEIVIESPGHVCIDRQECRAAGGCAGAEWTLTDWRGRELQRGTFDSSGRTALGRLPVGYYHVKSSGADATFAVVPPPECRRLDHNSFYGVDSAQSWVSAPGKFKCPWYDNDTYRLVSDLIWRAGLPHVRERLAPTEVNPRPGYYNFSHYLRNAELLHERGILISGVFHTVPKYMDPIKRLPRNLAALYVFSRDTAAAFGGRMGDWEYWNEQDIAAAPEPVWDYVATLKAAFLGFKAARPDMTVLPGALCIDARNSYDDGMYANDAAKYSDVFNFHTYAPISHYPVIFADLRQFMKKHGLEGRAVWTTECGTNLEGDCDRDGVMKGLKAHTPAQELVQAEFYAKSQIALQMQGVARNYFFIFGAFNERNGAKDWGALRRDGTVKPVYAAMSAITRELGSARLEGEVRLGESFKGYLFAQPDGTQSLAFWNVSPVDTSIGCTTEMTEYAAELRLPIPGIGCTLTDLCGQRCMLTTNIVRATRYPAYVSGFSRLKADVAPFSKGRPMPYTPTADEDLSIVLRAELNTNDFVIAGHKSVAELHAEVGRLRVEVWNLSSVAKTGSLVVAGGHLTGVPAKIAVPPMGKAQYDCVYAPITGDAFLQDFVLTGSFVGKRSSRLVIPVRNERAFLATCRSREFSKNWRNPKAWKRNTSATEYAVTWDESEQALRFDVAWTKPGDRWCYPIYELTLPEEGLGGALMFEFQIKSVQDKVENDFNNQYVMLVPKLDEKRQKVGSDRFLKYLAPLTSWEKRRVGLAGGVPEKDLNATASLSIGLNPRGSKCTYWIKDLRLLNATR